MYSIASSSFVVTARARVSSRPPFLQSQLKISELELGHVMGKVQSDKTDFTSQVKMRDVCPSPDCHLHWTWLI